MERSMWGRLAVGADIVIGCLDVMHIGSEARAFVSTKLGQNSSVGTGERLFGWVNLRRLDAEDFVWRGRSEEVAHGFSVNFILDFIVETCRDNPTTQMWFNGCKKSGGQGLLHWSIFGIFARPRRKKNNTIGRMSGPKAIGQKLRAKHR
jgi:hypothetical protein